MHGVEDISAVLGQLVRLGSNGLLAVRADPPGPLVGLHVEGPWQAFTYSRSLPYPRRAEASPPPKGAGQVRVLGPESVRRGESGLQQAANDRLGQGLVDRHVEGPIGAPVPVHQVGELAQDGAAVGVVADVVWYLVRSDAVGSTARMRSRISTRVSRRGDGWAL